MRLAYNPMLGIASAPLAQGDAGVEQTIGVMRQLYDAALKDSTVNRAAIDMVRGAAQYDAIGELQDIFNWVTSNIRFVNDPVSKETLRPPSAVMQLGAGDCDDISLLVSALAGSIGYEARLVTVAADPGSPEFTHVYAEVLADGEWVPMDAARPGASFGMAPQGVSRAQWWSLTDDGSGDLSGLGDAASIFAAITGDVSQIARQIETGGAGYSPYGAAPPGYTINPQTGQLVPTSTGQVAASAGFSANTGFWLLAAAGVALFVMTR